MVNRKISFLATYSYLILPSNGPRLYPPVMRRVMGRPKMKRKKANDEPTSSNMLPKNLTIVKCKSCENFGHNSRMCNGKMTADWRLLKGCNKAKTQKTRSTKEAPTVLMQGSQVPQTQETT